MKVKKNKGLAGIDTIVAIIAVSIFSTLIFTLMFNNVRQNIKLKRDTLAMIYITEIFENVGMENYENLGNGNYKDIGNNSYASSIENLLPKGMDDGYEVNLKITNQFATVTNNEDIMKKVIVELSYTIEDKKYTCSMERMKIKE